MIKIDIIVAISAVLTTMLAALTWGVYRSILKLEKMRYEEDKPSVDFWVVNPSKTVWVNTGNKAMLIQELRVKGQNNFLAKNYSLYTDGAKIKSSPASLENFVLAIDTPYFIEFSIEGGSSELTFEIFFYDGETFTKTIAINEKGPYSISCI